MKTRSGKRKTEKRSMKRGGSQLSKFFNLFKFVDENQKEPTQPVPEAEVKQSRFNQFLNFFSRKRVTKPRWNKSRGNFFTDLIYGSPRERTYWELEKVLKTAAGRHSQYSANLENPIIIVKSHGKYSVKQKDGMFEPLHVFKAPIRVYLYRSAQPSFCNYLQKYEQHLCLVPKLKNIYEEFKPTDIVEILNECMCNIKDPGDVGRQNYMNFCFNKVNKLVYEVGETIANKEYQDFSSDRENNGTVGVRVICSEKFGSDKSLLMDFNEDVNRYDLEAVVNTARDKGAKECHIIDMGCSAFVDDGVFVLTDEKHIIHWNAKKWGGK